MKTCPHCGKLLHPDRGIGRARIKKNLQGFLSGAQPIQRIDSRDIGSLLLQRKEEVLSEPEFIEKLERLLLKKEKKNKNITVTPETG